MKHATKHNQIHNIYIFSFQPASKQEEITQYFSELEL
jgi:hypothetical protein